MKRMIWFALLAFSTMAANATTLQESFDRTFDVRPGAQLVLSNVNGRITIHTSNEPRVRVHADKKVEARDSDTARRAMAELTIEAAPADGGVRIITREPRSNDSGFLGFLFGDNVQYNVTYDVTIPRTFDLDVSNVNGAVNVNDASGRLRVETTNGRIEMTRCAGTVDASTTNGAIRAELIQVAAGKDINLETTNGRITLVVPASLAANIDADTTNGSITTDLPVTTKSFDSNSLRGAINGGGPRLHLRTTNGSIEIRTTANQSASR